MKQIYCSIFLVFVIPTVTWGAIDTYDFETTGQQQRFHALANELRCPKCQNQNIADSNSEIAKDLRGEIHRLLSEGESDQQIVDFMVTRYGDFVLYKPPVKKMTYPLWFGPFLLVFLGGLIVFWIVLRSKKSSNDLAHGERVPSLSKVEKKRLDALLQQKPGDDGQ